MITKVEPQTVKIEGKLLTTIILLRIYKWP